MTPQVPPVLSAAEELSEYVENILFDGRLSQKLAPPQYGLEKRLLQEQIAEPCKPVANTPVCNGASEDTCTEGFHVDWPAREAEIELSLNVKGGNDQLPKVSKILSSASARVECLQKFAHHELTAVELFAWALLRFPCAPLGLRLGLLRTLAEEQEHCRLYVERILALAPTEMRSSESGHTTAPFGTPPLSGYMWRSLGAICEAPEPLCAFLCGIGLTFEAANLDHTLKHRDLFRQAGDEETAAVLQRVHDDEVRHVRLARVWLQRLASTSHYRDGGSSAEGHLDDADLYKAHAAFPPFELHKARGRPMLALDGRRRAGLSERFIAEVKAAKRRPSPQRSV